MEKKIKLLLLGVAVLFVKCDMFEYHPYDGHITGEKGINAKSITRIEEACARKETIRFVWMGDTQGDYDDTRDFIGSINDRDDIDFVMHGGDLTNFGTTQEYMRMRDIMNKLRVPYVVLIGNHDYLGTGRDVYLEMFGETNFSFRAGDVRFVNLETSSLGVNYSIPIPNFQFVREELAREDDGWKRTIVTMHVPPLSGIFNNNVAHGFHAYIQGFPLLQFCINAHNHVYAKKDLFGDGLIYYCCKGIANRGYIIFTITADSYTHEEVIF